MALVRLDPAVRLHVDEFLEQQPPTEILVLEEMIEGEVRVLELRASITGEVDTGQARRIEGMRRMLEILRRQWVEDMLMPYGMEQDEEEGRES